MAILKKPYEISVWEDLPEVVNGKKERKIAVIGSDQMTSPNKAFSPILTEKANGEVTFAFSMAYKYFDPAAAAEVNNPFIHYLINERKVKLHYDGRWYSFLVKTHSEDSESDVWTYELTDAYVNELSKVGYNVELNAELNNNQGTITELAQKVLKYTDWQVDSSDLLQQTVREPMYICTLSGQDLTVLNIDKKQGEPDTVTIDHGDSEHEGETLYVFYSYFANKDTKYIQFMREADKDSFIYDDNGTITGKNYRVPGEITAQYVINNDIPYRIVFSNGSIITIKFNPEPISLANAQMLTNQGYRKVYNQLMTYDPVMEKTVKVYNIADDERQIYDYEESIYSTSDVVQSFISNGNNFAVYDQGSVRVSIKDKNSDNTFIQGWSKYTDRNEDETHKHTLSIVTRPEITTDNKLISSTELTGTRGFLQLNFAGTLTNDYKNTFYNSGFENNISFIDHINRGEQYALRIAAGYGSGDNIVSLTSENMVRALIAKYTIDNNGNRIIDKDGIIFNFNGTYEECPSVIKNGTFDIKGGHRASYIIDGVPEAPSVSCVYRIADSTDDYIWDSSSRWTYDSVQYTGEYVVKGSTNVPFYEYYLTTAAAQQSISNDYLTNPEKNIGIFIYVNNNANLTYYISDIQITKAILDDNSEYVTIGNIPAAHVTIAHNYYIKPEIGTNAATVETFASLEDLGNEINYDYHDITPAYNEQSEKILSITESQSNCFNILQTLCETFECWLKIDVECDENGYIVYESGTPNKTISFHEYAGDDNFAGFKYGVNLKSIQRNLNSEEIVTKLIVDNSQSDYLETGILSIRNAPTNPSGEAYILNFDYYINKGLISDGEKCQQQLNEYYKAMREYNIQLNEKQTEKQKKEMSLIKLQSNTNIYYNLINEAKEKRAQAYDTFETVVGKTYEEYVNEHTGSNASASTVDLMQDEEISSIVADIYESSTVINSYSSVYINTKTEYQNLKLEVEGAKDYVISISIKNIGTGDNPQYLNKVLFDDYIPGFIFNLYNNDTLKQSNLRTSFNQKAFEYTDTVPYNKIVFTSVPDNYNSLGIHDGLHEGTTSIICTPEAEYKNRYPGLQAEIDEIQTNKDACEQAFYSQYSNYIKEGTWSSNDYIDPELYYFDAVQVGNTSAFPKVEYTVDVAEVSELKGLENYNFKVGEKSYVEDTEFFGWAAYYVNKSTGIPTRIQPDDLSNYDVHKQPAREEVIVSQVEWHLDEPENNTITIQNYKTQFEDLFQRISATVQTVQYNEATYAKTASILDSNGTINQTLLLASLNGIAGNTYMLTSDGSITIDGDCITIKNLESATNIVKIDSRGISITNNGGITWDTALDGNGLNAGLIYTGSLNTQQVVIGDKDDPSFRWDKYGISAYKQNDGQGEDKYDYRTYVRFDQYGLYGIENAADYKAASIDDVEEQAQFGITWHGFFIKNKYEDGGRVSITSDNDFQVIDGSDTERIKIGSLSIDQETGERIYGINISNKDGDSVFITNNVGDITITGKINAVGGNFSELVSVGKNNDGDPYIAIDGRTSEIYSSNYTDGAGWIINKDGDAVFNNITARGAIKTAVFEYAEIQAVGGVFLFRPTSTIKEARIGDESLEESEDDLILKVEKPLLFAKVTYIEIDNPDPEANPHDLGWYEKTNYGYQITDDITVLDKQYYNRNEDTNGSWCKVSNYISDGVAIDSGTQNILLTNGLTHVYQVTAINTTTKEVTLSGAAVMVTGQNPVTTLAELEGGALIDMGRIDGSSNYGVGINSSDNTVNLPARAISLFETEIHPSDSVKVTYNYKGILGTLPVMENFEEDIPYEKQIYNNYMTGTQGIYTDNMYIGDKDQHVAFYTDNNGDKHLEIIGNALSIGMVTAEGIIDVINSEEYTGTTIRGDRINLSQIISIGDPTKNHIKVGDISIYNLTEDTTKVEGKQYYVYDITTGAYLDPYKVAEKTGQEIPPDVNPKEEQWYELTLQRSGIGFYGDNGFDQIAYMSADKLWIPKTVVLDEMQVGSRENTDNLETDTPLWSWKKINAIDENTGERGTTHENLRLVWLGGDVD